MLRNNPFVPPAHYAGHRSNEFYQRERLDLQGGQA
jgi:hypothetical protein